MVLSVVVTLGAHMKFKSSASLYLGELQGHGVQAGLPDQLDFLGGRNGEIGTEIEILRSRDLLRRAVLESGLNATVATPGMAAAALHRVAAASPRSPLLEPTMRHFAVVNASLPDGAVDPAVFTVRFQSGGAFAAWAGTKWLGEGRLGVPFTTDSVRMTLVPGTGAAPDAGTEATVTVRPLDEAAGAAAQALVVAVPEGDRLDGLGEDRFAGIHERPRPAWRRSSWGRWSSSTSIGTRPGSPRKPCRPSLS